MSKSRFSPGTRSVLLVAAVVVLAILLGLALVTGRRSPQAPQPAVLAALVTTATAHRGTLVRTVPIAGVIRWQTEAQLAARMPARVLAVPVHEGDRVRQGQLLARLDDREARSALEAAAAGVRAAEAAVAKARSGAAVRSAEVDAGVTTSEATVTAARAKLEQARGAARAAAAEAAAELRRARAGLDAARANLAVATRGARPAQRRQAEAAVAQAEAAARAARRGLEEAQFLYDRGGLTRSQLEEARTADANARAQLAAAQASLELASEGAAPEERRAAEAAVRQAEAGVEAAQAGERRARLAQADAAAAAAQLRQAEAGLPAARAARAGRGAAREDVAAAAAALDQARVQWRQALEQVAATQLTSPVTGVVTLRAVDSGQIAQPGQPLIAVAAGPPIFEAPVSAAMVTLLRPGQPVELTSDAAPGRRFQAILRDVPSVPGPDSRTYTVRAPLTAGSLPPGVHARGSVQVARAVNAVLVPSAAVQRRPEGPAVWVAVQGRAVRRPVQIGIETDAAAQILTGITPGDPVIVSGAEGLQPGQAVNTGGGG